jgi:cobalt-zinc-cadmium efflux system outer membrane protein
MKIKIRRMMNKKIYNRTNKTTLCLGILLCLSSLLSAQTDSSFVHIDLTYKDYLNKVVSGNLDFAAQKFNVDIAKAQIEAAKIFQNPSIAVEWTGNKESVARNGYGVSTQLTQTIELGGKRKARINFAKSGSLLTDALLKDYLRNLQADATLDYLNALKQTKLYDVMMDSYQLMKKLADADSIRFGSGSIKAIDATQSKIEAEIILNNLTQAVSDRRNSFLRLSIQTSIYHNDTVFYPKSNFEKMERLYTLSELQTLALNNRADLLAAGLNVASNESQLTLTKKERKINIDVNVGLNNSYSGGGAYSPGESSIFTGIAIPLKFSNLNKSDIRIANYQVDQSKLTYKQVQLKVMNEVSQCFNRYKSSSKQVDNYKKGMLDQAREVLNGKIYSYSRGDTSLLEVLNARRTYNDLQTSYYETLYDCNAALVELQRAVGVWDIDF